VKKRGGFQKEQDHDRQYLAVLGTLKIRLYFGVRGARLQSRKGRPSSVIEQESWCAKR